LRELYGITIFSRIPHSGDLHSRFTNFQHNSASPKHRSGYAISLHVTSTWNFRIKQRNPVIYKLMGKLLGD
jgi:hypothetical protein